MQRCRLGCFLTLLHRQLSLARHVAALVAGEADVSATVLALGAQDAHGAAGALLHDLHILIGCKLLSVLSAQSRGKLLIG